MDRGGSFYLHSPIVLRFFDIFVIYVYISQSDENGPLDVGVDRHNYNSVALTGAVHFLYSY